MEPSSPLSIWFDQERVTNKDIISLYDVAKDNISYSIPDLSVPYILLLSNMTENKAYWLVIYDGTKEMEPLPYLTLTPGNYIFMLLTSPPFLSLPSEEKEKEEKIRARFTNRENFSKQFKRSDLGTFHSSMTFIVDNDMVLNGEMNYLSGPISLFYYWIPSSQLKVNGVAQWKKFYLFGDLHGDKENNCESLYPVTCSKYHPPYPSSSSTSSSSSSSDGTRGARGDGTRGGCKDITQWLKDFFDATKVVTDFFLEIPFRKFDANTQIDKAVEDIFSKGERSYQVANSVYRQFDYLNTLNVVFGQCFRKDKKDCPYSLTSPGWGQREQGIGQERVGGIGQERVGGQVRFHYADIRQHQATQRRMSIPEFIANESYQLIKFYSNESEAAFTKRLDEFNNLMEMVNQPAKLKEIYRILFTSENYNTEIQAFFQPLLSNTKIYRDKLSVMSSLYLTLGTDDGTKRVSRLKKQIDKLRGDGVFYSFKDSLSLKEKNMADLISQFIRQEYDKLVTNLDYDLWNRLYQLMVSRVLPPEEFQFLTEEEAQSEIGTIIGNGLADYIRLDALLMDSYILARAFRSYSDPKNRLAMANVPSQVVLTYTGASHTQTYDTFMTSVLGLTPKFKMDRSTLQQRCLH